MFMSNEIKEFIDKNADKTRQELIKMLMDEFGYKESTAKSYCSSQRLGHKFKSTKEKVYKFLDKNKKALNDLNNKVWADKLDMVITTYATYKCMYKEDIKVKAKEHKIKIDNTNKLDILVRYGEKYYKNRLRQTFKFDDSNL